MRTFAALSPQEVLAHITQINSVLDYRLGLLPPKKSVVLLLSSGINRQLLALILTDVVFSQQFIVKEASRCDEISEAEDGAAAESR